MLLTRLVGARRVKEADQRAARIDNWRRHAAQAPVRREEVLAAIDRGGSRCRERQPERVGAPRAFEPDAARDDVAPSGAVGESLIAQRIEHDARCVCEGDHEVGSGDLGMQRLHFRERKTAQRPERASLARDLGERRDDLGRRGVRVEAELETAAPALDDRWRERRLGDPLTPLEREARAVDGR